MTTLGDLAREVDVQYVLCEHLRTQYVAAKLLAGADWETDMTVLALAMRRIEAEDRLTRLVEAGAGL